MPRTKFNVSQGADSRTLDGIVFDSEMEMHYYRDVVLPLSRSGEITHYELQKSYTLQPKYKHDGKTVLPILYVADFYIEYKDGSKEVIDVKGFADSTAKLKRKMFWYVFPDLPYRWITYIKKHGGWRDWDDIVQIRRLAKKAKAQELKEGSVDES